MMNEGLMRSQKSICKQRVECPKAVGYRELFSYFDGDFSFRICNRRNQEKTQDVLLSVSSWFKEIKTQNGLILKPL
jgi:tRNA A37 N6-isopentenylltransferase MiaA